MEFGIDLDGTLDFLEKQADSATPPIQQETTQQTTQSTTTEPKDVEPDDSLDFLSLADEPKNDTVKTTDDSVNDESEVDATKTSLQVFYNHLKDNGVLPEEEFDGSVESFKEILNKDKERYFEEELSRLPDDVKLIVEATKNGVDPYLAIENARIISQLNETTEDHIVDNPDLQKTILKIHLSKTTSFKPERIDRQIAKLSEEELEQEALDILPELKEIYTQELEDAKIQNENYRQELQRQAQAELADLKKKVDETKEIIPNLPISKAQKDKIYDVITKVVDKDIDGTPLNLIGKARKEDKLGFEMKVAYAFLMTNGFKDWSRLTTEGQKIALSNLEQHAKALESKTSGGIPKAESTKNSNSQAELMNLIKNI